MTILVCSCDKDYDLFEPFHHCIEKYWKDHPEIIYATEKIKNPYYKTISIDEPLEKWTKRIRKTLNLIDDKEILTAMSHSNDSSILLSRKRKQIYASIDEFNDIYNNLESTIIKISENLEKGVINAKPIKAENSPCEYCTAKPICRNVQK